MPDEVLDMAKYLQMNLKCVTTLVARFLTHKWCLHAALTLALADSQSVGRFCHVQEGARAHMDRQAGGTGAAAAPLAGTRGRFGQPILLRY